MRILVLSLLSLFTLAGVTACGTDVHSENVSQGEQLIDLKNAKDAGAVSNSEYKEQKERLLDE